MRRVLERIRRLTVPRSVIGKLAELEARVHAVTQNEQRLTAQQQLLQQSQTALNARCEALQSAYQVLNRTPGPGYATSGGTGGNAEFIEGMERAISPRPPRADGKDHPKHLEPSQRAAAKEYAPRPSGTKRLSTSSMRRSKPRFRTCFLFGTNCSRMRGLSMRSVLPAA